MGSDEEPHSATLARASSFPLGQKEHDARRTEILMLAIGVLFLVSQLILIIWLFLLPHAVARRHAAQRDIAWTVMPRAQERGEGDDHQTSRRRGLRRSSTWNGTPVALDLHGEYSRRRGRPDGIQALDLQSPLSSSNAESDSDGGGPTKDNWDRGLTAAAALISNPLSPRYARSPLSSPGTEMESPTNDPGRMWTELGVVTGSDGIPGRLSPRSPRLQPIDQATISAILRTPGGPAKARAGLPTATPKAGPDNNSSQAKSYDDPLGVKRRAMALLQDRADTGALDTEKLPRRRRRQDSH